jgi:hypothetical protein
MMSFPPEMTWIFDGVMRSGAVGMKLCATPQMIAVVGSETLPELAGETPAPHQDAQSIMSPCIVLA